VLLEQGETLQRLFARYLDEVETEAVEDVEAAIAELNHSPAQALVVNAPLLGSTPAPLEQLTRLPYGTPALACWVPGDDDVAKQLGVVRYLVKPIGRDSLLSALKGLDGHVRQVLLVDDEQEALRLFSRMLSSTETQYQVLRAMSGRQALDLLRERRPDVILLDLIMPGMDGFQVLREKSQDASIRDIPVIVVSSRDPRGDPIVSDTLTVARGGGLSVRDLIACIQAVSHALLPLSLPDGRERPEEPAD
jgi:CheY-like chemotaxis protein